MHSVSTYGMISKFKPQPPQTKKNDTQEARTILALRSNDGDKKISIYLEQIPRYISVPKTLA